MVKPKYRKIDNFIIIKKVKISLIQMNIKLLIKVKILRK